MKREHSTKECWASGGFYHVFPGDILRGDDRVEYRIYRYLPEIHFESDQIRNGEALVQILEEYHRADKKTLAYVHGHNHGEQIYTERLFPIVSLGCNKMEDFQDKKPEGSWTYRRQQGTVTEDLWDVMIVHADHEGIDFVRFGAGEDKHIDCG